MLNAIQSTRPLNHTERCKKLTQRKQCNHLKPTTLILCLIYIMLRCATALPRSPPPSPRGIVTIPPTEWGLYIVLVAIKQANINACCRAKQPRCGIGTAHLAVPLHHTIKTPFTPSHICKEEGYYMI